MHLIRIFFSVLILIPSIGLADPTSYVCKFTKEASPAGVKAQELSLTYLVDLESKKAFVVGNAGSSEVHRIENSGGISFIEITGTGNVIVTAISSIGDAVHSRNVILSDKLIPSQYYGKCVKQ